MLQERVKYAMLGGSLVVVGTSIASHDLDARIMVLRRSAAAPPPPPTHTPHHDTPCDLKSDSKLRIP